MRQKHKQILFIAGFMALFAVAATNHATTGVMLTSFIEEYQLDGASQGLCGTAESIGFIVSLFISAAMLQRMPKTKAILIMAFFMCTVLVGIGLHPSRFLLLLFCYVVFGISFGIFDSLSSSVISDVYGEKSGKMMNYSRAVYCLGGMIAPPVMAALLNKGLPWHRVALLGGCFGIAVFLYYLLFASPSIPAVKKEKTADRLTWQGVKDFLKQKGAVRALLFGLMYYGHQLGLTIWIVRYISNYLHEPGWGGYALSFYWIGALSARFILPNLFSGHKKFFLFGNSAAAVLFITGILIGNGKLMCILVFLVGFAEGTTIPLLVDYVCSLDRSKSTVACSVVIFTNNLGSLFIPSVIGAAISLVGADRGIFILPLLSVACTLTALRMPEHE